jgi:crotonobetainyl-CoA:carnitine CoA-transferase CaiB-like acyl-CoA transferase
VLEETFAQRSSDDWLHALDEAGVPAGKVRGVLEALRRTAELGRPVTTTVEHPTAGSLELVDTPLRLDVGLHAPQPPPLLGQHTTAVLDELGYSDARIAELERRGVVATAG